MRWTLFLTCFAALIGCRGPAHTFEPRGSAATAPEFLETWIPLFDGATLDGWTPKFRGEVAGVNVLDTFRVEEGHLVVRYDRYESFEGRFGHLFHALPYSHFRVRAEYRFVGEQCPGGPGWAWRNNGLMLLSETAESMRIDQEFPVSIEVQLLGGAGTTPRTTANLCTPGTNVVMDGQLVSRHCTDSTSQTFAGDQWVTVEVEVSRDRIRHYVDGTLVLQYAAPQLDPDDEDGRRLGDGAPLLLSGGALALQAESHPCEFRRVEVLPLDP